MYADCSDTSSQEEEEEEDVKTGYVISVDNIPSFYDSTRQRALDTMRDTAQLYARREYPTRRVYLSHHIGSPSIDLMCWNTYAILNVDRVLHRFRVDKVQHSSSEKDAESEEAVDAVLAPPTSLPQTRVGIHTWFW